MLRDSEHALLMFCPQWGDKFAHYKIRGEAARICTMTATVSIRLVVRLEWCARKYYEMPLLVLAHVMDPNTKKELVSKLVTMTLQNGQLLRSLSSTMGSCFVMTFGALLTTLPVKIRLASLCSTCQEMC
jgi:hypothetical protein